MKKILYFISLGFALSNPSWGELSKEASELYETKIPDAPLWLAGDGKIGGKPAHFILDTGVGTTVLLDEEKARTFGPPTEEMRVNETTPAFAYRIPDVQLGRLTIPAHPAPATDLKSLAEASGIHLTGFIGWPGLAGKTLTLNYDLRKMTITEGASKLPNGITVPLEIKNNNPYVHGSLGDKEIGFLIDTGHNGGVFLTSVEFSRLLDAGLIEENKLGHRESTIGGGRDSRSGKFVKGTLLGVDLKEMSASEHTLPSCGLGLEFLTKLNFSISNAPGELTYQVRKSPPSAISPARILGAFFAFNEKGAVVTRLKPGGGQAEKAGLEIGDCITSMGGLSGGTLTYNSIYSLCADRDGKPIPLKVLRNEKEMDLKLTLPPDEGR